ncbi:hypothetical protein LCGC14_3135850, partial [marine sediment metagenome]
ETKAPVGRDGNAFSAFGKKIPYFAEVIKDIRVKYKIPKNLKAYFFKDYDFAVKVSKFKFSKLNFEQLDIEDEKFERLRVDGVVNKKDYKIVSTRIGDEYLFLLFTNNLKSFKADFFKTKIKPRKGLFRLVQTCFGVAMARVDIKNVTKPTLNLNLFSELTREINSFKAKEQVYKANGLDYKRGILLYGLPGNGKTCFIKHLLKEQDAISIMCDAKSEKDIDFVFGFLNDENTRGYHKIIVLEDIDRVSNEHVRSRFLNLIDGIVTLNRTLFIATLNNPKDLDHALTNRPSRFDSLYEVESPNEKSRKQLLKSFFPDATKKDIKKAIDLTKQFRGAHFK